jgi:hypothetical protein
MRRIVLRPCFRLRTNVETGRTMRTPQPYAADLVRVHVAQCLFVQYVLEVSGRIGITRHAWRDITSAVPEQNGQEGLRR